MRDGTTQREEEEGVISLPEVRWRWAKVSARRAE